MLGICVRTRDDQRGYDIIDRMARSGVVPDDQVWPCFQRRINMSDEIQNIDLMARSGVVLDNRCGFHSKEALALPVQLREG